MIDQTTFTKLIDRFTSRTLAAGIARCVRVLNNTPMTNSAGAPEPNVSDAMSCGGVKNKAMGLALPLLSLIPDNVG